MSTVVGYGCAALCVVLLAYSIRASARGDMGMGLVAVALAFALLMGALAALRVKSRL